MKVKELIEKLKELAKRRIFGCYTTNSTRKNRTLFNTMKKIWRMKMETLKQAIMFTKHGNFHDWWYRYGQYSVKNFLPWIALAISIIALIKSIVK